MLPEEGYAKVINVSEDLILTLVDKTKISTTFLPRRHDCPLIVSAVGALRSSEILVDIGGVFEREYTEELIILEVATASALYPSFVRWRIF
jgi:hypothetical protein